MKDQWEWLKRHSILVIDTGTSLRLGVCSWRYMPYNQRFKVVNCPWYICKQLLHINLPRLFVKCVNKDPVESYMIYIQSFSAKETKFSKSVIIVDKINVLSYRIRLNTLSYMIDVLVFFINLIESWWTSQHFWP